MKACVTSLLSVGLLATLAGSAHAEQGLPSQAMLSAMGLSGIQVMSDSEALTIRGLGYGGHSVAIAYGKSYANVGGYGAKAGSKDGFFAKGKYSAKGKHGSYAGKIIITKKGGRPKHGGGGGNWGGGGGNWGGGGHGGPKVVKVKKVFVFAGGYAKASAY